MNKAEKAGQVDKSVSEVIHLLCRDSSATLVA
jgi:hypothetical protein